MRIVATALAIAISVVHPFKARAFDRCDTLFAAPGALKQFLLKEGVYAAPVKYFAQAKTLRIDTDGGDRLIPFVRFDAQGQATLVYPSTFPAVACRLALATYLGFETTRVPMTEAANESGQCIAANRPREDCIKAYAKDLERRYQASFAKLPDDKKGVAYQIVSDVIAQVAKHEFAHRLLNHAERTRSGKIARIDAEFEADFYAVLNGTQTGEIESAMYYFFDPLAEMEDHAPGLKTPDYESATCRAINIDDLTGLFGLSPMALLDAVQGGGRFANTPPDYIRTVAQQVARQTVKLSTDTCGRLAPKVLRETLTELVQLTAIVADYADILPAKSPADRQSARPLDNPAVFKLINRLQVASQELTHLKGLAAGALSQLIRRVGYAGAEANIARELDRIVQLSEEEYLSSDYGRILSVRALHVLYDNPRGPLDARMNEAEPIFRKSVEYLPQGMEAWLNLAFIAFLRGDCDTAATMADKSARTANPSARSTAEGFRDSMKQISKSGRCATEARRFADGFSK